MLGKAITHGSKVQQKTENLSRSVIPAIKRCGLKTAINQFDINLDSFM